MSNSNWNLLRESSMSREMFIHTSTLLNQNNLCIIGQQCHESSKVLLYLPKIFFLSEAHPVLQQFDLISVHSTQGTNTYISNASVEVWDDENRTHNLKDEVWKLY